MNGCCRIPEGIKEQVGIGNRVKSALGLEPRFVEYDKPVDWQKPYDTLRRKWGEIPITNWEILSTEELLALPDDELLAKWEKSRATLTTGAEWDHRGWYHALYADSMGGKKVIDIGSGFGVDSITFAQHGARMTFVDLVERNLKVLQRLCKILGLKDVEFQHFQGLNSLRAGHGLRRHHGHGIASQCSSRGDEA